MNSSELTNAELLRACIDTGAAEDWAEFIARFQPLIAGVLARMVVRRRGSAEPALVDDLVQETYLRLCRNNCRALREFRPEHEASFFGYLKSTASSVALDHFRAQGAARRGPELATLDEAAERHAIHAQPPADALLIQSEIWRRLEAIAESPRDIAIFRLYYQQGFTAREIAAVAAFGLKEKGVESCLQRLIARLKQTMKFPPPNAGNSPGMPLGDVG